MAKLKYQILSQWLGSIKLYRSSYFQWLLPLKTLGFPYMHVMQALIKDFSSSHEMSVLLHILLPPFLDVSFIFLPFWKTQTVLWFFIYVRSQLLPLFPLPIQCRLKVLSGEMPFKHKFYQMEFLSLVGRLHSNFWSFSFSAFKYLFL